MSDDKEERYYLNLVSFDTELITEYCKDIEQRYKHYILVSRSFIELKDGSYLLSLVFNDEYSRDEALRRAQNYRFDKRYTTKENFNELSKMSNVAMVGTFSYKYLPFLLGRRYRK